jgi:diacylglycerol kinase (ATP)
MSHHMKVKLILNPFANVGRAEKQLPQIRNAFEAHGVTLDVSVTLRPQHATQLARDAAQSGAYRAVVVGGGDGTLNEVVNGLVLAAGEDVTLPLAILPLGTGNDFSDMQGIQHDVTTVAARIVSGIRPIQVDIGQIEADDKRYYFDNNCAAAMEAAVNQQAVRLKRLRGRLRYVAAVGRALMNLQEWQMRLTWDDGALNETLLLLSVCNGPRTGSTFMMSPNASITDGLFDVVTVPRVGWGTILRVIPRIVKGTHLSHPDVTHFQTQTLRIISQPGTPIHADGEMVADSAESITLTVLPGKLTLLK